MELRGTANPGFFDSKFPLNCAAEVAYNIKSRRILNPRHVVLEWLWKSARLKLPYCPRH